ncbi:MAG TPA: alpha/beta hydrolase [Propionibacteriaceae bacterium]|nr:alpha/beta hydrolase [Propionibacteriaceae bacterium]
MTTSVTRTGSSELHWRRAGVGSPLLLLHGITDSSACWGRVMGDLAGEFDMVATDARGHGRSSRWAAGVRPTDLADDAAMVIRDVFAGPVAVWGHSMGAATATLLAARHPDLVTRLVLEDPPYSAALPATDAEHAAADMWVRIREMLQTVREAAPEERVALAQRMNPAWPPAELPGWVESKLDVDENVLGGDVIDRDWRTPLASVTAPVLLVIGSPERGSAVDDATAEALVQAHPDTQVRRFPVGHNVHREAYEDVLGAVRAFLTPAREPS